jgi:hypothetical protein
LGLVGAGSGREEGEGWKDKDIFFVILKCWLRNIN